MHEILPMWTSETKVRGGHRDRVDEIPNGNQFQEGLFGPRIFEVCQSHADQRISRFGECSFSDQGFYQAGCPLGKRSFGCIGRVPSGYRLSAWRARVWPRNLILSAFESHEAAANFGCGGTLMSRSPTGRAYQSHLGYGQ